MSRMLAYVAPAAMPPLSALGGELLEDFASLSRVHRDGWGASWRDGSGVGAVGYPASPASAAVLGSAAPTTAQAVTLYLRFGSVGAGTGLNEAQPFLRSGRAFAHNGALHPADRLRSILTPAERARLRGVNDSELYFTLVLRHLSRAGVPDDLPAVRDAVLAVRHLYPDACLNAFVVTPDTLIVVHSSGSRPAPLSAFAARGLRPEDLPEGHDEGYNHLYTRLSPTGARIVITTGVRLDGWDPVPDDGVSEVTSEGWRTLPLPSRSGPASND